MGVQRQASSPTTQASQAPAMSNPVRAFSGPQVGTISGQAGIISPRLASGGSPAVGSYPAQPMQAPAIVPMGVSAQHFSPRGLGGLGGHAPVVRQLSGPLVSHHTPPRPPH